MKKFINCTPHEINLVGVGIIPVSGTITRVGTTRSDAGVCGGVRVTRQMLGQVENLPQPTNDTIFIVSGMVLDAIKKMNSNISNRAGTDVFAPDTGSDAVRENGQIVAVLGLVC
jgi:hypothetical protein